MTRPPLADRLARALQGRSVALTGHTGFKGAWMIQLLERLGAAVHGLALDPEPGSLFEAANLGSRCATDRRGDVTDASSVADFLSGVKPDYIVHMAAESLVRRSYRQPAPTFATNVMGTVHLLEAARRLDPTTPVLVVTSDKVYANDGRPTPYQPGDRLGGHDPYSASKAASELVVDSYRRSFNLNVATVRAGNVIGGGDVCEARLLPDAIRAWTEGAVLPVRSPRSTRPWQHVLDPLMAYLELVVGLGRGEAWQSGWNVGPAEPAWTVADILDEAVRHWPGARWIAQPEPGAPVESARLDLDVDASLGALEWRPTWDTPTAVGRTVAWARARASGADAADLCAADLDRFVGR